MTQYDIENYSEFPGVDDEFTLECEACAENYQCPPVERRGKLTWIRKDE